MFFEESFSEPFSECPRFSEFSELDIYKIELIEFFEIFTNHYDTDLFVIVLHNL